MEKEVPVSETALSRMLLQRAAANLVRKGMRVGLWAATFFTALVILGYGLWQKGYPITGAISAIIGLVMAYYASSAAAHDAGPVVPKTWGKD